MREGDQRWLVLWGLGMERLREGKVGACGSGRWRCSVAVGKEMGVEKKKNPKAGKSGDGGWWRREGQSYGRLEKSKPGGVCLVCLWQKSREQCNSLALFKQFFLCVNFINIFFKKTILE